MRKKLDMRGNEYKSYIILIIISLLLKIFQYDLVFGISLEFASIVLILILLIYGNKKALLATILVNAINIIFFEGEIVDLIQVAEVYIIYLLCKPPKKKNIIISDIKYWIVIGIPINLLYYVLINYSGFNEYYYFDIAINFINSILNVFICEIIYIYYVKKHILNKSSSITFNSIIVHILTAAMLIPFVSSMIIDMKKANNEISSMVDSYANEIF
ncbi:MAG: hypothetical protein ACRC2K_09930, partial [Clostridium sp.]